MPQLRTFSAYAPTPNIGGTTVGAMGVGQRAAEASMQARIEREKIRQQMAIAEMENATKRAALANEALQSAQELEVQKAYQQGVLGLRAREVQSEEQKMQMAADEAARQYSAQESMRRSVQAAIDAGKTPGEAFAGAVSTYGVEAGAPGSAFSDVIQTERAAKDKAVVPPPVMQPMEGAAEEGFRVAQVSPNQWQVFQPTGPTVAKPVPGVPGQLEYRRRILTDPAYKRVTTEIADIQKKMDSDEWFLHRAAIAKEAAGEKLTQGDKVRIREYRDQVKQLKDRQTQLADLEKRHQTQSSTNRIGRFTVEAPPSK